MIAKTLRTNLMTLARAYAKATRTPLSQVSKKFYGHSGFIKAFGTGEKSISIDNYDRIVDAIRDEWPEGAEWPHLRAAIIHR